MVEPFPGKTAVRPRAYCRHGGLVRPVRRPRNVIRGRLGSLGTMPSAEGNLTWTPLADSPELVAPPVAAAASLVPGARVAPVDPALADTAAFCEAYDVAPGASANCVIVMGRRGEDVRYAAVMVLAVEGADININAIARLSFGVGTEMDAAQ